VTLLTSATVIGRATAGVHSPRVDRLNQATTTVTVMLLVTANKRWPRWLPPPAANRVIGNNTPV
jgi:hypothetical protein